MRGMTIPSDWLRGLACSFLFVACGLSPLRWEQIALNGYYLWRSSAKLGAVLSRPPKAV